MIMQRLTLIALLTASAVSLSAQMWIAPDSLYGNEWIDYDQTYYKIKVADDGVYRVSYDELQQVGGFPASVQGGDLQLWHMGREVRLVTSTESNMSSGDYFEFYGVKNRGELDVHLYEQQAHQLNPYYSLFNDTSAYFLVIAPGPHLRYTELANTISNLPAPESDYQYELNDVYADSWTKKYFDQNYKQSRFEEGEGYARNFSGFNLTTQFNVPVPKIAYGSTELVTVEIGYLCRGLGSHDVQIYINDVEKVSDQYVGYKNRRATFTMPVSELSSPMTVRVQGNVEVQDRNTVSYVKLTYPRDYNMQNQDYFEVYVSPSADAKYLRVVNFDNDGVPPVALDIANGERMEAILTINNNRNNFLFPAATQKRELKIYNPTSALLSVASIQPRTFVDYSQQQGNYVILTSGALRNDGQGNDAVQAYADYRASAAGGGYTTTIAEIDQLYDQYAYGIDRHNIAARNFIHQARNTWSTMSPKYLMVLGKGMQYTAIREEADLAAAGSFMQVATFGVPGADNLITARNQSATPELAVGRLAVSEPSQIMVYLAKLQTYEAAQQSAAQTLDRQWMKRLIHLGGGTGQGQQTTIRNSLNGFKSIIENSQYGAEVESFFKNSSDPLQSADVDDLTQYINDGSSILLFYGHAGPNTFDFTVDNPSNYENFGRFPVFISYGCYSGQVHLESHNTQAERFAFEPDKGAIAFMSSTGVGYISALNQFGQIFYNRLGNINYGETLGEVMRLTIADMDNTVAPSVVMLLEQQSIHGDPAIRINTHPGPDYLPNFGSVQFEPEVIGNQLDSFTMRFAVENIGYYQPDSMTVRIEQRFPTGEMFVARTLRIATPPVRSEVSVRIPVPDSDDLVGPNRFFVTVDADDDIDEAPAPNAETNNTLVSDAGQEGVEVYFVSNEATPLSPADFGIATRSDLRVTATTSNAFAPSQKYFLEMDTTANFDSPLVTRTTITQVGGMVEWEPALTPTADQVYYWRISPDSSTTGIGFVWSAASFLYRPDLDEGWNQSDYYQYLQNEQLDYVVQPDRRFKFTENEHLVRIRNGAITYAEVNPRLYVNTISEPHDKWQVGTVYSGVFVAVMDPVTGLLQFNSSDPGDFGSYNTEPGRPLTYYAFQTNSTAEREKLINFLQNDIADGQHVFFFTIQMDANVWDYQPEQWADDSTSLGTNVFQVLEGQGATQVRDLAQSGSVPYILHYQKGVSGTAQEYVAPDITVELDVTFEFAIAESSGIVRPAPIGPATAWGDLTYGLQPVDDATGDAISIDVYGVAPDGSETSLMTGITATDTDMSGVDAAAYPYLRLELTATDVTNRTAPQLDYWRLQYTPVPEAVLSPATALVTTRDSVQQGEPYQLAIAVANATSTDMDSLLARFVVLDPANNEMVVERRFAPLAGLDTIMVSLTLDTRDRMGMQRIRVIVNPDEDQPEQYAFNNVGFAEVVVYGDEINPVLDVTFDGTHIMDGDLVSGQPLIRIQLDDENPWIALTDSTLMEVEVQYPGESSPRTYAIDGNVLQFYPASSASSNRAYLEFRPDFDADGDYMLTAQASDPSGNISGSSSYTVRFEVVNATTLSNVLPYPNPFTTQTQFVYTMTGRETPDYMKIQILTVSGRIVREITADELGPLKVGTHRTDFVWDGTDNYGDKLANGVYLYRVVALKDGEPIDLYESGADTYITNGYGKLMILR